jgi:putative transposase
MFSYREEDVVAALERACRAVAYPKATRVGQSSEFVSRDLDLWAYQKGAILDFSRTGNSLIVSLNRKFQAECVNVHWFMSLDRSLEKMDGVRTIKRSGLTAR